MDLHLGSLSKAWSADTKAPACSIAFRVQDPTLGQLDEK
jgi:hypothetical protein